MANGRKQELLRFETDGHGVYKWEVITQKPFAEFKEAVNEGHDSSWLKPVVERTWEDKTVRFQRLDRSRGARQLGRRPRTGRVACLSDSCQMVRKEDCVRRTASPEYRR